MRSYPSVCNAFPLESRNPFMTEWEKTLKKVFLGTANRRRVSQSCHDKSWWMNPQGYQKRSLPSRIQTLAVFIHTQQFWGTRSVRWASWYYSASHTAPAKATESPFHPLTSGTALSSLGFSHRELWWSFLWSMATWGDAYAYLDACIYSPRCASTITYLFLLSLLHSGVVASAIWGKICPW